MHQAINFGPLAQAANGGGNPLGGMFSPLLLMVAMFAIMYFIMIRPQKKERQRREQMLANLRKNDHVVTAGGIHGVVTALRETEVTVRVDDARDVKVRVNRSAIAAVVNPAEEPEEEEKKN